MSGKKNTARSVNFATIGKIQYPIPSFRCYHEVKWSDEQFSRDVEAIHLLYLSVSNGCQELFWSIRLMFLLRVSTPTACELQDKQ